MRLQDQRTYANDQNFIRMFDSGEIDLDIIGHIHLPNGTVIKPKQSESGYMRFGFTVKGYDTCRIMCHRAMWLVYRGPIPVNMYIDHVDEDKTNNSLSNLQLVTHGTNIRLRKPPTPRMTTATAIEIITKRKNGMTLKEVAAQYPYHYQTICDVSRGRSFKHLDHLRLAA